jgi:hypothetical protein
MQHHAGHASSYYPNTLPRSPRLNNILKNCQAYLQMDERKQRACRGHVDKRNNVTGGLQWNHACRGAVEGLKQVRGVCAETSLDKTIDKVVKIHTLSLAWKPVTATLSTVINFSVNTTTIILLLSLLLLSMLLQQAEGERRDMSMQPSCSTPLDKISAVGLQGPHACMGGGERGRRTNRVGGNIGSRDSGGGRH